MAGIYIHIPFCRSKCIYCDFYSITECSQQQELLESIKRELKSERQFLGSAPIETIYFGGGTPSLYKPSELEGVIETIETLWGLGQIKEITIELNPDDISEHYLEQLKETRVNRLSIGVQSFVERDLRFMRRRHSAEGAERAIGLAKEAGYENITLDLIFGIPGMSMEEWKNNLERAIALGVNHISAYHLTVEGTTPLVTMVERGEVSQVEEEQSEEQFGLLHKMLREAGYEHYEISNFAKPGWRAVHNSSYWSGAPYLGVGPSAHSYDGESIRRGVVPSVECYIEGVGTKDIYDTEYLTPRDLYNEFVMVSLRTAAGVDLSVLESRFGLQALERFKRESQQFLESGVLRDIEGSYRIPPCKFLISDSVIAALFI